MSDQTPSQTVGPYFAYAFTPENYGRRGLVTHVLVNADTPGERINIEGCVYDGNGDVVNDAVLEIWQANAAGRYRHPEDLRDDVPLDPAFKGAGRTGTDAVGRYRFETIKPGAPGDGQAPHISVVVMARGVLSHLFTRIYFPEDGAAHASDRVLQSVPEARRATLVAQPGPGPNQYRFDVRLQGASETVFFDA